jgi:hypothetical protein
MMSILYMPVAGIHQPQNRQHIPQPAGGEEQTKNVHNSHQVPQPTGQCATIPLLLFAGQIRPIIAVEPRLESYLIVEIRTNFRSSGKCE